MQNSEHVFYRHRDRFNALVAEGHADTAEAAGLFYYLNRTGYNGLTGTTRQGTLRPVDAMRGSDM